MAETATDVREQAQEKAQEAASKVSDTARSQIDHRSTELGERVGTTADDIRTVGQQLREQGKDQPAKLADQTAQRVERVGEWLRNSDGDRLLSDVEDFGRRQPWALALGGLALGIAASRFLKASSAQRYQRHAQPLTTNGSPTDGAQIDAERQTGIAATRPAEVAHGVATTPAAPASGTEGS
jgi:hypothetical protein